MSAPQSVSGPKDIHVVEKTFGPGAFHDAIAAVSLANLIFIRAWGQLLQDYTNDAYWLKAEPRPTIFLALMLNVLALGGLFFWILRKVHLKNRMGSALGLAGRAAVAIVVFLTTAQLISSAFIWAQSEQQTFGLPRLGFRALVITQAMALLVPIAFWIGHRTFFRGVLVFLRIVSPLVLLTFAQGIYHCLTYDPNQLAPKIMAPRLSPPPSAPRVLWFIFDEWDQDLTFPERPADLRLPEIDRLRQESFYSDTVTSPGPSTDFSMPALTIGKPIASKLIKNPSELLIRPAGSDDTIAWSKTPTIFSDARSLGLNTSVITWALPYCRVLGASLTTCDWLTESSLYNNDSLFPAMLHQLRGLFENQFRSPFGQSLSTQSHAWLYGRLKEKSEALVAAGNFNLALLHMPVPHPPFFFNRRTGKNDLGATPIKSFVQSGGAGYIDALAVTDRYIGEIRRTMEAAGTWDNTSILFSADHPYRERHLLDGKPTGHYVPFILKLARQEKPLDCSIHFSALLTREMLTAILKREISTPDDANAWIARHKDEFAAD